MNKNVNVKFGITVKLQKQFQQQSVIGFFFFLSFELRHLDIKKSVYESQQW